MHYVNASIVSNKDVLKSVTSWKDLLSKGCFQNAVLFLIFATAFFKTIQLMHGLQQMQCNSNHYSIKRNTLVELKILSVSNDYKPMKLWSSFSEIWE